MLGVFFSCVVWRRVLAADETQRLRQEPIKLLACHSIKYCQSSKQDTVILWHL